VSAVAGGSSRRSLSAFNLLEGSRTEDPESALELATWHRGVSIFAESFRSTVTSLLLAHSGNGLRTVVVTSPGPSEGKSTILSNLAIALVETSKNVLIIDADIRNPRLHTVFHIANSTGLTDLIQQQAPLTPVAIESLTQRTEVPNLYLLPSGPAVRSVSGLLFSRKIGELFRCCHDLYDIVLIDSPPILQFGDARILGRNSDGVILVLRSGRGRMDAIAAAARLGEDGVNVLGTILNDWDPTTLDGSHYSRYYKYYADLNRTGRYAGASN
jgi:capsular exopolysaccharide synthesis family protein